MPDDRSKKGPQDRTRINIHEAYELEYWSKEHFKVSKEKLIEAVKKAGVMVKDVEKYFSNLTARIR
jgi:hypothetical protein